MAATKRNAGLASGVPRPTLNDEELVSIYMYYKELKRSLVRIVIKK